MDNLIRIREGLPVVHLEYGHLTGTVTQQANGKIGGSQTSASAGLTNLFNFEVGGSQINQLTLTAEPVTNPEVYNAYLEFLKDPNHLAVTMEPPAPGQAIIVRCRETDCGGTWWHKRTVQRIYYWVPCEYQQDFRRLCLFAVAMRGEAARYSPYFDVVVKGVLGTPKLVEDTADTYQLLLKLDKSIPNDNGWMSAVIAGRLLNSPRMLRVLWNEVYPLAQVTPEPVQKTDEIVLQFSLHGLHSAKITIDDVIKDFVNQKVGIRLENFLPTGSRTETLLEDIRMQLELQRLGQQVK